MSKPPLIFIIVIVAIILLAGRQFFRQRSENALNDASPVVTQQALVVSKRDFTADNRRSRQREVIAGEIVRYEVTFRREPVGDDFSVQMSEEQYNQCRVGTTGALRMQGTRFIGFTAGGH
ncbi:MULTISPECIES: DUF2500 domain-containing protein [Tatumella]|uniref:DUF2500 domain-containing protein n=1 Tax=Tatumella punctata TaxID=399969 RepID=A0ABW1VM11_9GAMM|nr:MULTISPECIES: DUF2500 domain-containing protein [unclassified Tatumella]MBS0855657.1 DUF2500 domain-containing protein [Tatumella sp. JGM16]MBS0876638.1 DUF2500 domain-containing protein [Tatumella sp. JGM82]MBS0889975.1 DUF2500 domain-containing protein [Tatumella sp. JGM94]MBS0893163.1 DUF2500 domain-containing protein [Tatumella sp. JGM130]MBS0901219.1 DUF2500 domain-containing protein [Tatumella sp. JGM100]